MSRTPRPINSDRMAEVVAQMITAHAGKPCPTRRQIVEWTGLQRRNVWPFLKALAERGLIEIETRGEGTDNVWRRMRVVGGQWTGWTERRQPMAKLAKDGHAEGIEAR